MGDYRIIEHPLSEGQMMLVLSSDDNRSFIDRLIRSKRTRSKGLLIARTAQRICRNGIEWACVSRTLRLLDNELALFELRIHGETLRVMTYLHDASIPVYLFDFAGHKGKTGLISSKDLEKGKRLASIARKCMAERGTDEQTSRN